jgi:phage tail sheath protein FI
MGFQLSPGVQVSEIDLTTIVPSVATSIGGIAGKFAWGPVNEVVTISDEVRLVDRFGKPNNTNAEYWFSAANFLAYSNTLKVVRAANSATTLNATSRVNGNIQSYIVLTSGDSATGIPTVTVLGSNTTQATATVNVKITGVEITNVGTGYEVGDQLTPSLGTFSTAGLIEVTGVDENGNVTAVTIDEPGVYSVVPTQADNQFAGNTSTSGTGFTADLTFGVATITADDFGDNYSNYTGFTVSITGSAIANATATAVLTQVNANTNGVLIENEDDYENNHDSGANTFGEFAAKWPGDLGNGIRVEMADAGSFVGWTYAGEFTGAPATSTSVATNGGANDEIHIIVIDEKGKFSGTPGTILEKYEFVSKASDAKIFDGSTNYYKNVVNSSRYIWWLGHPAAGTNWGTSSQDKSFANLSAPISRVLANGADGNITDGNLLAAYDRFANADSVDVNLLIAGPANATVANYLIDNIAEVRKDCVVFISPEKADVVNNYGDEVDDCVAFRNTLTSSSYAVMDSNWKYQFDKFNDIYRWVPLCGDIAGLCARTDQDRDPWYSPGGLNRGIIKNVVKLAWNPNKTDRDGLYVKGINPIVTFPGEGTILFGDKTLLARPSAFDRINVRRLFIVLEKAIARAARSSLFEFNDTFTRAQFVNLVEPFLRDVQGRRGIYDFRVVCDETNNTGEVIDRNEFIGDIYIKPARSINFIQLNFVAVRTGVSFDEVVGKFG